MYDDPDTRLRLRGPDGLTDAELLSFLLTRGGPPGPQALQIPCEFGGNPLVTPQLIAHAHAYGVQVHVWTIDEEAEMHRLLDLGVDGLVTNFPARMRALLARRGERG